MVTKDINAGLFSKVARFVRNPTKDWSELDKPEPEPEAGYTKQALKEMIERKRQNDFVRRREFDHLRKLRRNEPLVRPDVAGRPSFFQSSLPSNQNERATTLKKIDDIEAQMSKQWWKGKQEPEGDSVGVSVIPGSSGDGFATTQPPEEAPESSIVQSADYESTAMGLSAPGDLVPARRAPPTKPASGVASRSFESGLSGFSASRLFAVEMGNTLTDPDLEEAAIRFANGDDAGAEAGLLAALQADNADPASVDGWASALFDLYRATGKQASFDRVAIDCAQRFGRSAPGWFSTPDLLGRKADAPPVDPLPVPAQDSPFNWECPEALDWSAVNALRASLSHAVGPWRLNWSRLSAIAPDAAQALAALFDAWCSQAVSLRFAGADVLERVLRQFTSSGDPKVESCWWELRLNALRLLHLQDEFELAALDYCVTYEVSPPPWEDALCDYCSEQDGAAIAGSHGRGAPGHLADPALAPTSLMALDTVPVAVVELSGEVLGDAAEALNKFQDGLKGANRLVVSCARLIRVDFSAAGSILNWVALRQAEGCHVQFRDTPRLVAVFFNVIGINEHARIILRTN